MEFHPTFGPSLPEKGWVPAPSYLLRRNLVREILAPQPPQRLLEIGPGAAMLLYELAQDGWECTALEQSEDALALARLIHQGPAKAQLVNEPGGDWEGNFDWLLAMEVLEHIEDDSGALLQWRNWLAPGGRLLLSVPAHQEKWSPSDVWAGHYRRYERDGLEELLTRSGFRVESLHSYGFPLANFIEPIRAWHHGRLLARQTQQGDAELARKDGTEQSGISRSLEKRLYPLYANLLGSLFMKAAFSLQKRFLNSDRGTGYLVLARRSD